MMKNVTGSVFRMALVVAFTLGARGGDLSHASDKGTIKRKASKKKNGNGNHWERTTITRGGHSENVKKVLKHISETLPERDVTIQFTAEELDRLKREYGNNNGGFFAAFENLGKPQGTIEEYLDLYLQLVHKSVPELSRQMVDNIKTGLTDELALFRAKAAFAGHRTSPKMFAGELTAPIRGLVRLELLGGAQIRKWLELAHTPEDVVADILAKTRGDEAAMKHLGGWPEGADEKISTELLPSIKLLKENYQGLSDETLLDITEKTFSAVGYTLGKMKQGSQK